MDSPLSADSRRLSQSFFLEVDPDRNNDLEGLMISEEQINEKDFRGSPVLKDSFIYNSRHIIRVQGKDKDIVAEPAVKGSDAWSEARKDFIEASDRRLRQQLLALTVRVSEILASIKPVIESFDWVHLLECDNRESNRESIINLCGLHNIMRSQLDKLNNEISLRAFSRKIRMKSATVISYPPDCDDDREMLDLWVEDVAIQFSKTIEHAMKTCEAIHETVQMLNTTEPGTKKLGPHENEQQTFVARRTSKQSMMQVHEAAEALLAATRHIQQSDPKSSGATIITRSRSDGLGGSLCRSVLKMGKFMKGHLMPEAYNLVVNSALFDKSVDDHRLLASIVSCLRPVVYAPNSVMIKQDTLGGEMFFLSHGTVKVLVQDRMVDTRHAGDLVGEIALAHPTERTASVVSQETTEVYQLERSTFRHLSTEFPVLPGRLKQESKKKMAIRKWTVEQICFRKNTDRFSTIEGESADTGREASEAAQDEGSISAEGGSVTLEKFKTRFCEAALAVGNDPTDVEYMQRSFLACFQRKDYEEGELIARKGQRGAACILISQGSAVGKPTEDGEEPDQHHPDHLLGLETLLFVGVFRQDVTAGPGGCSTFEIDRQQFLGLCEMHEEIHDVLPLLLGKRSLESSSRSSSNDSV